MACGSPPGIRATAKGRSLLAGNACLREVPDDLGRDGIGALGDQCSESILTTTGTLRPMDADLLAARLRAA
jgi:hypothetical protein